MEKILIGKYVNTHGIKGEIRIKSNFKYKDKVFQKNKKVIIAGQEFIINSYRKHKDYDMITLNGISSINEILSLKGSFVYVDKCDLNLKDNEYLDTDLIGLNCFQDNKMVGIVEDVINLEKGKKLLVVNKKYVPFELIKEINFPNKKIIIEEVQGLI